MLSDVQIKQFHANGYLVLEKAIEKSAIENLRAAALQIVDDFDIDRHRTVFTTGDRDRT